MSSKDFLAYDLSMLLSEEKSRRQPSRAKREPSAAAPKDGSRKGQFTAAAAILLISLLGPLAAQSAEDDARDARIDAILATPNLATPVPQSKFDCNRPRFGATGALGAIQLQFLGSVHL
jgi:hypothetical protein